METTIPTNPLVFRYRSFNINNLNALNNNYLWFSDFYTQNDPFDGMTDYEWDRNDDPLIINEIKKSFSEISQFDNKTIEDSLHYMSPYYSDRNPILISCFSLKCDETLLWSHYANGHRGFCQMFNCIDDNSKLLLEIDLQSISSNFEKLVVNKTYLPLIPVIYQNDRGKPLLSSQINTEDGMKQRINNTKIKYTAWQYESELRCVVFNSSLQNKNKVFYPQKTLFGVILGCEIDCESEKLITAICLEKKCHLYKMQKVYSKFEIEPKFIF